MRTLIGLLALLLTVGLSAPASAQTVWHDMHARSFEPTTDAAAMQLRQQRFSEAQSVAYQKQLEAFLDDDPQTTSSCEWVTAKDGVTYVSMGMNRPGFGPVAYNLTKQHGRDREVISCNVDGETVHWFSQSSSDDCNNVGVVARPKVQPKVCRMVAKELPPVNTPTTSYFIPGHVHDSYCGHDVYIPPLSGVISGTTIGRTALIEVCE